jgi:hypothetical protein
MRRACWIVAALATAVFTGWAAPAPAQGPVTVASGATKIARWELYASAPGAGGRCVGMRIGSLFDESNAVTRERCGPRRLGRGAVTLQTLAAPGMGSFAYGRAGRKVGQVSVTVGDQAPVTVGTLPSPLATLSSPLAALSSPLATLPSPLGRRGRFWVVPVGVDCAPVKVQALGVRGNARGARRSGRIGPRGCG